MEERGAGGALFNSNGQFAPVYTLYLFAKDIRNLSDCVYTLTR